LTGAQVNRDPDQERRIEEQVAKQGDTGAAPEQDEIAIEHQWAPATRHLEQGGGRRSGARCRSAL
jgi:hypothetical protein